MHITKSKQPLTLSSYLGAMTKTLLTVLMAWPLWLTAQAPSFLEKHRYSHWVLEGEQLSFLEGTVMSNPSQGAQSGESFLFHGITYETMANEQALNMARLLECCMCSFNAIVQNDADRLILERGARGDFGDGEFNEHTFYLDGEVLVHETSKDYELLSTQRWLPDPAFPNPSPRTPSDSLYANSWLPLNVRSAPNLQSDVVAQLEWRQGVRRVGISPESIDVPLNFKSSFPSVKSPEWGHPKHMLHAPFVEIKLDEVTGHVFEGFVSASRPFDLASFFENHMDQSCQKLQHKGSEVLWKERLDLGQREEGLAFKEFTMHRDGVVLEYAFDGKSQESVTVDMPLNTIDEFHVMSNNLLRFLKEADSISNGPEHLHVMLTETGPSFHLKMSPNKKRMLLQYEGGGS